MKIYTYSQARQNLALLLTESKTGGVLIRRSKTGEIFRITPEAPQGSPLNVQGINTKATTRQVIQAIREVRVR